MSDVEDIIDEACLDKDFNVWSGECLTIAKAISDCLGGRVVLISEVPDEGFDHACVEIDGRLYDGSGPTVPRVSWIHNYRRFSSSVNW